MSELKNTVKTKIQSTSYIIKTVCICVRHIARSTQLLTDISPVLLTS